MIGEGLKRDPMLPAMKIRDARTKQHQDLKKLEKQNKEIDFSLESEERKIALSKHWF